MTKNGTEDSEYYSLLYKDINTQFSRVVGRRSIALSFGNFKERGAVARPCFAGRAFIKSHFSNMLIMASEDSGSLHF